MSGPTVRLLLRWRWTVGRGRSTRPRSPVASNALWVVCAALLLGSVWFFDWTRRHRQADGAAVAREVAPSVNIATMAGTDAARLAAFAAHLPAQQEIPLVLRELIDRAALQGVSLARGSYQTVSDPSSEFTRFRMIHPVTGGAGDVHRFLMDSLRLHRALALESVQFKRQDARSSIVEVRIQWTLFTRPIDGAATTGVAQ